MAACRDFPTTGLTLFMAAFAVVVVVRGNKHPRHGGSGRAKKQAPIRAGTVAC